MPNPSSTCSHRTTTFSPQTKRDADPTRCIDCGAVLAGRELRPAWEHALTRGDPARYPRDWGYGDAEAWLFSEFSPYRPGRLAAALLAGGLPGILVRGDLALDAEIAANLARIVELVAFVRQIGDTAPPPLPPALWEKLPPTIREMRLTYVQILGWCGLQLVNAIRRRGGDHDGIVRPSRQRETPFSCLRHALAVAFTEEGQLGPRSKHPSGVVATHALPMGVALGTIACNPTRSGGGDAQGEDHVLLRLAVHDALQTARLGQEHVRRDDGTLQKKDPGTEPLSAVHIELLRLVLVGADRGTAHHEKHSVVPAIEELPVRAALEHLKRRRLVFSGMTDHEARLMFKNAREAVADQLFAFGLIPPPGERRHLPRSAPSEAAANPFALPGAS